MLVRRVLPSLTLLALCACAARDGRLAPTTTKSPRAPVAAALLAGREIVHVDFARKTLWSWTKVEGARWLCRQEPPRLLRWKIHDRPPDVSYYDVHLRGTRDRALGKLLSSPPFDRVRYAWPNAWGASLGLDGERYGDQLVRIVLRDDAIVARFVPTTDDGLSGAADEGNPYRFGLPEWSFFDLSGREVAREVVLADPSKLAAVYHLSSTRTPSDEHGHRAFAGYRELALINEAMIAEWSLAGDEVLAALHDARVIVQALSDEGAVPRARDDDQEFLGRTMLEWGARGGGVDRAPLEARWFLTLPFPRPQYRDLGAIVSSLDAARGAQAFHRVVFPSANAR